MFNEIVKQLTDEQRTQLRERGITRQLLYKWREGEALPTEVQVADVAAVTGTEWVDLQKEITVLRAPEGRRAEIARTLGIRWRMESAGALTKI